MSTATAEAPVTYRIPARDVATAKQLELIARLTTEREWAGIRDIEALGRLLNRDPQFLAWFDRGCASTLIDQLFAAPYKLTENTAKAEAGYYVRAGVVYVVVANKAGTGTYAKRLVVRHGRGSWEYAAGVGRSLAAAGLVPLTVEEAAKLGRQHGVCVVCAKTLVNPESVSRGMGDRCAAKLTGGSHSRAATA